MTQAVKYSMPALMNRRKMPRVNTVIGNVNRMITGLINVLMIPRAIAAMIAEVIDSTSIPSNT
jgi:hypothetical protein